MNGEQANEQQGASVEDAAIADAKQRLREAQQVLLEELVKKIDGAGSEAYDRQMARLRDHEALKEEISPDFGALSKQAAASAFLLGFAAAGERRSSGVKDAAEAVWIVTTMAYVAGRLDEREKGAQQR